MTETEPSHTPGQQGETTELRLALVMNGGVSLAVWMGGVVHELELVCRASRSLNGRPDDPGSLAAEDRPVFDRWRSLLERTHLRVKVDIVSGTSAGGLNGLLLATAIGRGGDLPDLRGMWEKSADLKSLLVRNGGEEGDPKSVFNGRFFSEQIELALGKIEAGGESEPVTLFVTATALDGRPRKFKDGFDQQFDVRDHRRVYRFNNQPGGDTFKYVMSDTDGTESWDFSGDERREFTVGQQEALVLAARATASFPGAFPPVSEDPLLDYRVLPEKGCQGRASCVMDGGVLNNAPFGPVLDEIARRPLEDQPVERVLVYVVPSAGHLAEERVKDQPCDRIGIGTVAFSALNYPQEADFRSGADDLDRRLKTSVRNTREDLFARMMPTPDPAMECAAQDLQEKVAESAVNLLGEYRRNRIKAVVLDTLGTRAGADSVTAVASPRDADDESIDDIVGMTLPWCPPASATAIGKPDLESWQWGVSAAERLLTTLCAYLNALAVAPHHRHPAEMLRPEARARFADGAKEIHRRLRRVLAVRDAVRIERQRRRIAEGEIGTVEAARLVERLYADLDIPRVLGREVGDGARMFVATLGLAPGTSWAQPEDLVSALLSIEVLTVAFVPPSGVLEQPTPRFTFLRLGPDSMGQLFRDDWSADIGDKKLYGVRFRHFGAFINSEWRRSDFTWGRLDAAHHLLPLLLPDDESGQERELHELILDAERSGDDGDQVDRMRNRLKELAGTEDADLLGARDVTVLKETGVTALDVLVPRGPARWHARRIWHLTWRIWAWRRPRRGRKRSLPEAAKWAVAGVVAAWVVALVLLGVVLLGWAAWG